ncbi:hypothetical protein [Chryseobacterium pennipullorum]|nr:hypothetical protein [Chryseobacterium pennipullorum]
MNIKVRCLFVDHPEYQMSLSDPMESTDLYKYYVEVDMEQKRHMIMT